MNVMQRLNGWQRLWVVATVAWSVIVLTLTLNAGVSGAFTEEELRPFIDAVPDRAVRARLTKSENAVLSDRTELLVGMIGGNIVNPYRQPDPKALPELESAAQNGFDANALGKAPTGPGLSVAEFARRLKRTYRDLADKNDDVIVANVLARYPVYHGVVDPQSLAAASNTYDETIAAQRHTSEITRSLATAAATRQRRERAIEISLMTVVISSALLYLLGWSVAWVRHGFTAQ